MQFKMARFWIIRTGKHMLLMLESSDYGQYDIGFNAVQFRVKPVVLKEHTACIVRVKEKAR
jgi:hypothetical protein